MSVVEFKASVSSAPALSVVIALEGEIDMASAPMLADLIDTGFQVGKPTVVLEMSGVTFLDSQGLGTLLRAERRARDARDALVLRSPSKRVRDLLMLAGVESMFSVDPPVSRSTG